ncbi:MAG: DUF3493 domain-containing protein [Cyanobacteria bacterium J06648_16]
MPDPTPRRPANMSQEKYERLLAEAQAPWKSLRKFIYAAFGTSGLVGAFVFFFQVLAGRNLEQSLPNLVIQLGVVGLMVFLFRLESRSKQADE